MSTRDSSRSSSGKMYCADVLWSSNFESHCNELKLSTLAAFSLLNEQEPLAYRVGVPKLGPEVGTFVPLECFVVKRFFSNVISLDV